MQFVYDLQCQQAVPHSVAAEDQDVPTPALFLLFQPLARFVPFNDGGGGRPGMVGGNGQGVRHHHLRGAAVEAAAIIFTVATAVVLAVQMRLRRYRPGAYWFTVVMRSITGSCRHSQSGDRTSSPECPPHNSQRCLTGL